MEEKISKTLPKILEVNLIAKELKREINFQLKIRYNYIDPNELPKEENHFKKKKIQIKVFNKEECQIYLWNFSKFLSRYYIIKELYEKNFENEQNGSIPKLANDDDVINK